jgi:hypothetical protein
MALDRRRCAAGRLLAAVSLALLSPLSLELGVLLGCCLGGLASLDLGGMLGTLALQAVSSDKSLNLGALGDVLLALGGAVDDTLDGVMADVIHLPLHTFGHLLLGHTWRARQQHIRNTTSNNQRP